MNIPDPKYPNSAGRLLALLEILKPNQAAGSQLIPIFLGEKVPQNKRQLSLAGVKAITKLHIMYAEFLQDLATASIGDEEKSVLVKGLTSLENMMYPQSVGESIRPISEAEKALLEVCATRLQKENVIEKEDIKKILESVQVLKDEIDKLPSDATLRTVLLELTRLSEDSINRFNIYGSKGLKRAFKDMLAEVAEIYLQEQEDVSAIRDSTAWENTVKHIKLFDSIASKAMKYRPLLEKTTQFFIEN